MKISRSKLSEILAEEITSVLLEQRQPSAAELRGAYNAGMMQCEEGGCTDQQYAWLADVDQRAQQAEQFEMELAHAEQYAQDAYRAMASPSSQATMTADTTPRDYEGLDRVTQAITPPSLYTLQDPEQGLPTGRQVAEDATWETAGAAIPFVSGRHLKKGWDWVRRRLPGGSGPAGVDPRVPLFPGPQLSDQVDRYDTLTTQLNRMDDAERARTIRAIEDDLSGLRSADIDRIHRELAVQRGARTPMTYQEMGSRNPLDRDYDWRQRVVDEYHTGRAEAARSGLSLSAPDPGQGSLSLTAGEGGLSVAEPVRTGQTTATQARAADAPAAVSAEEVEDVFKRDDWLYEMINKELAYEN